MKKTLIKLLRRIFSIGIAICILLAGVVAALYVVSFLMGGEAAAALVYLVNTYILKVLYYAGTIMGVVGILKMYLAGEKAYVMAMGAPAEEGEDTSEA